MSGRKSRHIIPQKSQVEKEVVDPLELDFALLHLRYSSLKTNRENERNHLRRLGDYIFEQLDGIKSLNNPFPTDLDDTLHQRFTEIVDLRNQRHKLLEMAKQLEEYCSEMEQFMHGVVLTWAMYKETVKHNIGRIDAFLNQLKEIQKGGKRF